MALQALLERSIDRPNHDKWLQQLIENKEKYPYWYEKPASLLSPQWVIEQVHTLSGGDAIVTTDVGQHQMWAAQYYTFDKPNRWVTSGGLGTMGFGFPSAIGVQLVAPDDLVVDIVGDGGFQMTSHELSVIKQWNLPVKIVIVNNEALGMVRQWQQSFYDERYSESLFSSNPDFVKLAESYGVRGYRVSDEDSFISTIKEAFAFEGPALIDCRVVQKECVYPMIAPGKGIHQMVGVSK